MVQIHDDTSPIPTMTRSIARESVVVGSGMPDGPARGPSGDAAA